MVSKGEEASSKLKLPDTASLKIFSYEIIFA